MGKLEKIIKEIVFGKCQELCILDTGNELWYEFEPSGIRTASKIAAFITQCLWKTNLIHAVILYCKHAVSIGYT